MNVPPSELHSPKLCREIGRVFKAAHEREPQEGEWFVHDGEVYQWRRQVGSFVHVTPVTEPDADDVIQFELAEGLIIERSSTAGILSAVLIGHFGMLDDERRANLVEFIERLYQEHSRGETDGPLPLPGTVFVKEPGNGHSFTLQSPDVSELLQQVRLGPPEVLVFEAFGPGPGGEPAISEILLPVQSSALIQIRPEVIGKPKRIPEELRHYWKQDGCQDPHHDVVSCLTCGREVHTCGLEEPCPIDRHQEGMTGPMEGAYTCSPACYAAFCGEGDVT